MKSFFKKIYIKVGQFNGRVLDFVLGLGFEFFFYLFFSIFLTLSMMIGCPAFISLLMPIGLTSIIELTFRGFLLQKIQGKPSIIKSKLKDLAASIIGAGIGLLLAYAWITIGAPSFIWF